MIKLAVTGFRSKIVHELIPLVGLDYTEVERIPGKGGEELPPIAERYVLAAGILQGKRLQEQTPLEIWDTLMVNLVAVMRIVEFIFDHNPRARVCVLGSASGIHGSFDLSYAAAKAAVHWYCTQKKVPEGGQLVCLIPPIISDAGMTLRRHDYPEVLKMRETVTALEVARSIKDLLWDGPPASCLAILQGKTLAQRSKFVSLDVH